MIRVEKDYLTALCNSCGSDNCKTILINYKNTKNGGMAINLCDDCRKEMIRILSEVEE